MMIFQYTIAQVLSTEKTQTRRIIHENEKAIRTRYNRIAAVAHNNRVKWCVGKTYAVQPGRGKPQVARIRIVQINSEYVSRISQADACAEGFVNRQGFLHTWRQIHGENSHDIRVWVLKFELVAISVEKEVFLARDTIETGTVLYDYG